MSDRSRALEAQIAALEAQIKQLSQRAEKEQSQPHVRSRVVPQSSQGQKALGFSPPNASVTGGHEPVFEPVDHRTMASFSQSETGSSHYNDLGMRKYDLVGAWRRLRNHLHGPATGNSKLVSYLAAGTIKGLRPLRYEKRVARNRFVALAILLLLLIFGILKMLFAQS
ncbi:MAG: hypothetical protein HY735_01030 [Verrucomicrobia bacterium]|nr:hypothetical protein [Verrucomicrobiota bacterium]